MNTKENLENVFSQLSNVENIDEALRDEGYIPEQIIKEGLERLNSIRTAQNSKFKILEFIKAKMKEAISNDAQIAMEKLSELVPSLNSHEVNMVFKSLENQEENDSNIDQLILNLKSDSELQKIMKKYNS